MLDVSPHLIPIKENKDSRGYLKKYYTDNDTLKIKQVLHSQTILPGTVRGLHVQIEDSIETKRLQVIKGAIFDLSININRHSENFMKVYTFSLNETENQSLLIPPGYAHAYQVIEKNTEVLYFSSSDYNPNNERVISPLSPYLEHYWPMPVSHLSEKDKEGILISETYKGIAFKHR